MSKIIMPAGAGQIRTPDQERAEKCQKAIGEICKEFRCQIVPWVRIVGGRMDQGVSIEAIPEPTQEAKDLAQKMKEGA